MAVSGRTIQSAVSKNLMLQENLTAAVCFTEPELLPVEIYTAECTIFTAHLHCLHCRAL